jgi:hypothetical protein
MPNWKLIANIIKSRILILQDRETTDGLTERQEGEKRAYINLLNDIAAEYADDDGAKWIKEFLYAAIPA